MKTTFVSTQSLQNTLRQQILNAQVELQKNQQEATTGIYADIGEALGGRTKNVVDLTGSIAGLQSSIDANGFVNSRLSAAQTALSQMSGDVQAALDSLVSLGASGNTAQIQTTRTQAANALQSFLAAGNLSSSGEYLFAGINTAQKPLTEYTDGSAAQATFEKAFSDTFGFTPDDSAQVAGITADQMKSFLDSYRTTLDATWTTDWSSASDTTMTSRISNNETIQSSVSANSDGVRGMAFASVVTLELLDKNISGDVRTAVVSSATSALGASVSGLNLMQSQLGISQARVKSANDALSSQKDIATTQLNGLQGVDPYEAATKVNTLLTQLETSYTLTGRIQQLSLVDYL
ncbi:MAG: flagellar hook-associated family protein [Pararhizobium sp.]